MRIAVLGTGMVGRTLAGGFAAAGHEVAMGTRDPAAALEREELREWHAGHPAVAVASLAEAAASAEVVVNATSGAGSLAALEAAGADALAGKALVDVSNPLEVSGDSIVLFVSGDDSLAERIQRAFPDARVVKTLNTVNASLMVEPDRLAGGDHTMFVAGNDADANATVAALLRELGWRDVLDLGGLEAARGLEAYLLFWLRVRAALGDAGFSVKVVRPDGG